MVLFLACRWSSHRGAGDVRLRGRRRDLRRAADQRRNNLATTTFATGSVAEAFTWLALASTVGASTGAAAVGPLAGQAGAPGRSAPRSCRRGDACPPLPPRPAQPCAAAPYPSGALLGFDFDPARARSKSNALRLHRFGGEEVEHPRPGVGRGPPRTPPACGRRRVGERREADDLVFDARPLEPGVEGGDVGPRDVRSSPREPSTGSLIWSESSTRFGRLGRPSRSARRRSRPPRRAEVSRSTRPRTSGRRRSRSRSRRTGRPGALASARRAAARSVCTPSTVVAATGGFQSKPSSRSAGPRGATEVVEGDRVVGPRRRSAPPART